MGIIQGAIYGFVTGFTEFLPVPSSAHQFLMLKLFGQNDTVPLLNLCIHMALLLAVCYSTRSAIGRLLRDRHVRRRDLRSAKRISASAVGYDLRLIKSAAIPMAIVMLLCYVLGAKVPWNYLPLFLIINGVVLMIPEHTRQANKDARAMSAIDAILIGLGGALSVFPGISRNGVILSYAVLRGADKQHATNWALLLSIPALVIISAVDIFLVFTSGIGTFSILVLLSYIAASAAAFGAGLLGIRFLRFIAPRLDFSGFAYYSWGIALFGFLLYLIT